MVVEQYRGRNICMDRDKGGTFFSIDGSGPTRTTLLAMREHIDYLELQQDAEHRQAFQKAPLKGYRDGENARIEHSGNLVFSGTMREARRRIFDIEDAAGESIVWQ